MNTTLISAATNFRSRALVSVLLGLLLCQGIALCAGHTAVSSDGRQVGRGRVGCPECKNDGSEIAQLLEKADSLYAGFKTREAQKALLKVLQLEPKNHEALAKLSRVHIDFGDAIPESEPDWQQKRLKQYRTAEEFARNAVQAKPNGTWGHFYVATSLGKIAAQSPITKQVDLAREVRSEVGKAIALDPENGFAYHVYGVWHRRMAEIGQMSRMAAVVFLWRSVPKGSLEKSVEYLTKAISLDPTVISHHLELAKTYMAMGQRELAYNSLKAAQEFPIQFSDDALNKREAQALLQEITDR